jgi:reverse gyrase
VDRNWIIAFGEMNEKEKEKAKERIRNGDFE